MTTFRLPPSHVAFLAESRERTLTDLLFDTEFRTLIPPPSSEELIGLEQSLLAEGNREPVVIWKETRLLLDGHNRYDLCHKNKIVLKPPLELSFPDRNAAVVWIIRNQFGRRNLNTYQRSVLALKLENILRPIARERQQEHGNTAPGRRRTLLETSPKVLPIDTRAEVARTAGVSDNTIAKVKVIEAKATPAQKAKLVAGTATVNQVYVVLKREEIKAAVKEATWPEGKFRVFYVDPPWEYHDNRKADGTFGAAADHYPTMTIEELCAFPNVRQSATDDAVLFLWVTVPMLEDSFRVVRSWGFTYKACFVWDKVLHVMGHYNSVRHELLLVAVKGSCQPDVAQLFDSVQTIERNGHSEKPIEFRDIIDTIYPYGPRVEVFAREKTEGWAVFGHGVS